MILIRQIKRYHPANFLILIIIGLLAWFGTFLSKDTAGIYFDPDPMPIYQWIYSGIGGPNLALLCKILGFVMVILQAILLNSITNQSNLLGFRSYLPGLFFVIITANFQEFQMLHPILFANLFFLIAWERISNIIEKSNAVTAYFNSAFFIGIASLFYPNYAYFLLIIALSASLNRISHLREFTMIAMGFITVWYFYLTIYFIFYNEFTFSGIDLNFSFGLDALKSLKPEQLFFLSYVGFILSLASFNLSLYMSNVKIQIRRNLKFLFSWFLAGLLLFIFTQSGIEVIYVIAAPISMLFAIFFLNIKNKWLPELAWFIIIGLTLINQFFTGLL